MRGGVGVLAVVVALLALGGVAVAGGQPIVSAGLDQDVALGDTVYLDAGGTHAPDGELAGFEWSIEGPSSRTVTPECVDCGMTSFVPNATGRYDVTLTAESDAGVERSDTLYVNVSMPETDEMSPPSGGSEPASSGASGGGGCFVSNEGDNGEPMNSDVCGAVGSFEGYQWMDRDDNVKGAVLEDEGFADEYSGYEKLDTGKVIVPTYEFNQETTNLYGQWKKDQLGGDSGNFGGGNSDGLDCWYSSCPDDGNSSSDGNSADGSSSGGGNNDDGAAGYHDGCYLGSCP